MSDDYKTKTQEDQSKIEAQSLPLVGLQVIC